MTMEKSLFMFQGLNTDAGNKDNCIYEFGMRMSSRELALDGQHIIRRAFKARDRKAPGGPQDGARKDPSGIYAPIP